MTRPTPHKRRTFRRWTIPNPGLSLFVDGPGGVWIRVHCDDANKRPMREAELTEALCAALNLARITLPKPRRAT
jgi:hypothetical protein